MFDFRPIPSADEDRTMAHLYDAEGVLVGFVSFVATEDANGFYSRVAADTLSEGRSVRYTATLQAPDRLPRFTDEQVVPEVPMMNNPLAEQLKHALKESA